jgi:hypothetical protein
MMKYRSSTLDQFKTSPIKLGLDTDSAEANRAKLGFGACLMLVVLSLGGCASSGDKQKAEEATANASSDYKDKGYTKSQAEVDAGFDTRVGAAITSPLNDLNLTRAKIPEVLVNARKAPYTYPADASCVWFTTEIHGLNLVLGPDLDAAKIDDKGNIVEKELGNATVNALKSFTEGFVPFRSWVRRITGADSHAREVAAAGLAGIVRRSYLKGIATARACRLEPIAGAPTSAIEPAEAASAVEQH